jgi:ABC-2 type transport system ATP-binding protein
VADRVVIISSGKVVAEGTPDTLVGRQKQTTTVRFRLAGQVELPESLGGAKRVDGEDVEIETADPTRTLYDLTSWAVQHGVTLGGLEVTRPSLEDVYLEITGGVAGLQE